jgi:hypothetical protein
LKALKGSRYWVEKHLVCLLPHHLNRILIFPDSKEDRLSESIIPSPFRKSYLAHHHRLDPVATSHFNGGETLVPTVATSGRKVEKGTFINSNFVQLCKKSVQEFFAKTGPNSASKFKSLPFVETNKQRAKMFPRSFGFGVAADHEFLLLVELHLDPRSASLSCLVPGTAALTNQTFKSKFASPFQKLWDVFCE